MIEFKQVTEENRIDYLELVEEFYATDAVLFDVNRKNFEDCFQELMRSNEYTFCHLFILDSKIVGYALIAKTYSQEAGGIVWWVEEIYIRPEAQSQGIGTTYFQYLVKNKPENVKRIRLEVEKENEAAVCLYKRWGFQFLGYDQMYMEL